MIDPAFAPSLAWAGDRHLRICVGPGISDQNHRRVREAYRRLKAASLPGARDLAPAYGTILVSFDLSVLDADAAERQISEILHGLSTDPPFTTGPTVEIPVCYEGEFAPDIGEVARLHGLTVHEVMAKHAEAIYTVHFVGFSPGFGYLSGLPVELATPRLDSPRTRVPAGSVGIAGDQTGIYPHTTAGGWRLIGRTPLRMFDADRQKPSVLEMGDRVKFTPIDASEFHALERGDAGGGA